MTTPMPALQFILTTAGKNAIINANNTGTNPVIIDRVAIGSVSWTPTAAATALNTEIKKITAIGGGTVANDTIHVTATDSTADVYTVREVGLYTSGNVLLAIYSQADPIIVKGAGTVALIAADLVITGIPADSVTVGDTTFDYPQATTTVKGVAEIATTAEAQAGTDDERILTPKKLQDVTATEDRKGVIELATAGGVIGGTVDNKAITPATLVARTATEDRTGLIEIATTAEAQTGTDDDRALTPKKLQDVTATESRRGVLFLASQPEVQLGTNDTKAATPLGIKSLLDLYGIPVCVLLAEGSNLNNVANTGFYRGTSGAYTNKPVLEDTGGTGYDFEMIHLQSSSAEATQVLFAQGGSPGSAFFRQKSASSWQTWSPFVFSGRTANTTREGILRLATNAEAQAGTNAEAAVTPASLASVTALTTRAGLVELATSAETQTGSDTARAVTPAGLAACTATTTRAGVIEIATNTEAEAGTDADRAMTPYTTRLHPGVSRAWVSFNGVGTVSIIQEHNVTSVTDLGPGLYQINWDVDFGSSNYAWVGTARASTDNSSDNAVLTALQTGTKTVGALRIRTTYDDGGVQDCPEINVVTFA